MPLYEPTAEDLAKPLAPTDLPVEDYASPLMHTASFFGTLFRWSVFGSVTIVIAGVAGLTATHLWVEKVELAGGINEEIDDEGWSEDLEGWSGAHRGGGTDPRLGVLARSAIRGAWIASHWGSGGVASPVTPVNSSPFAVSGGARIGASSAYAGSGSGSAEVADAGLRLAEQYLAYALDRAARKGILVGGADAGPTAVDPAALELEQRLASVRERLGGLTSLAAARDGWERVYYALAAAGEVGASGERQRLLATRKLGELSARMAGLCHGREDKEELASAAKGWFLGGLMPALKGANGAGALKMDQVGGVKHVSAGSSFWSFWTRQHPKTTPLAHVEVSTKLPTVVADLVLVLNQQQSTLATTYSPATQRALLRSLVALETHLALTRQLDQAHAVQHAAVGFAQLLIPTDPAASAALRPTTLLTSTPTLQIAHSLSHLFILTRASLLRTHLAEVELALLATHKSPATAPHALALLADALSTCELALGAVDKSPLLDAPQALFGGRVAGAQRLFGRPARAAQRDARRTGAIAAGLLGHVHGECGKAGRRREKWCGGDETARVFWERSLELAREAGDEGLEAQARRGNERAAGGRA